MTNAKNYKIKWQDKSMITKSQWKKIILSRELTSRLDLKIILVVYDSPQNRTTASEIAKKLCQPSPQAVAGKNTVYSKRICSHLQINPPKNDSGGNRWWTIPYWGTPTGDGKYFYILRPELKQAIEELISEGKIDTHLLGNKKDPIKEIKEFKTASAGLTKTERESIIKSRIGQGEFRTNLIEYWGNCSVTACKVVEILKASHIKPWRSSDNRERLDVFNGLLLIPNLDSAFDNGLISFDNEGKIILSNLLGDNERGKLGIHTELSLKKIDTNHLRYLEFHRRNIFKE